MDVMELMKRYARFTGNVLIIVGALALCISTPLMMSDYVFVHYLEAAPVLQLQRETRGEQPLDRLEEMREALIHDEDDIASNTKRLDVLDTKNVYTNIELLQAKVDSQSWLLKTILAAALALVSERVGRMIMKRKD